MESKFQSLQSPSYANNSDVNMFVEHGNGAEISFILLEKCVLYGNYSVFVSNLMQRCFGGLVPNTHDALLQTQCSRPCWIMTSLSCW